MHFDESYYERFYYNPSTAVATRAQLTSRARLIAAFLRYFELPVRRILDAGCGVGSLRRPLLRELQQATYVGLEVNDYACQRYGWKQGSIDTFRTKGRFDLIVCYDVFQYLDDTQARNAIDNLARLCRGALYFGALTKEDWRENCDRDATDRAPYLRSDAWYRQKLKRHFVPLGCGMWVHKNTPIALWSLEVAE